MASSIGSHSITLDAATLAISDLTRQVRLGVELSRLRAPALHPLRRGKLPELEQVTIRLTAPNLPVPYSNSRPVWSRQLRWQLATFRSAKLKEVRDHPTAGERT
jgi:hypothetical protein